MHVELVVPALFGAAARAPAAELLLARGRRTGHAARELEGWLGEAFGLGEASLPAGALSAFAGGLETGAGDWLRADPVYLHASQDGVRLLPVEAFALQMDEAAQFAAALNAHFAGDFALHVLRPGAWALQARRDVPASGQSPLALAGRGIHAALPAKRGHALLNEIQMALHLHPLNAARQARGEREINGLWLWGAGRLPAAARGPWQSVSAEDLPALGLARLAQIRHRAPGTGAEAWLERAPEDGRHLVVLDALRAPHALREAGALTDGLCELETRWFAPLLAALRAGRIGMLSVHVPDAGFASETVRGDLRRFWRRARPLQSYATAAPGGAAEDAA